MGIKVLLLDVGGVLLSNGWDRSQRERAAEAFNLDFDDMQAHHEMVFEDFERGLLTLEDYIKQVVFLKARSFSLADFRAFMLGQVTADPPMLALMERLKADKGLKVFVLSNEGQGCFDGQHWRQ